MDEDDHRVIGSRLDLFHQEEDAPGMVYWHPKGAVLWHVLEGYIHRRMREAGFGAVRTPQLLPKALWERSGHWEKFGSGMFALADGAAPLALKPMSCPGHIQLFNRRTRSYRELPIRYCEFGACHRNEPSGAVQGLMRTRAFVQDDAHIFCRDDQIEEEVRRFCRLLRQIYGDLGFGDFSVGLSTRPAQRAGSDRDWDRAEALLAAAARAAELDFTEQPGEGAFYGPKLEFQLPDRHGRRWQCGTVQLDFVLPERLDAAYVDADNRRVWPAMIHHAVLGSLERFIAILLEHHGGRLPFWLAPIQIAVAPVNPAQRDYARGVELAFERHDLRAVLDDRPETLSRRIVDAREGGIPVFVAVGAREEGSGTVSLRRASGERISLTLADAAAQLRAEARL